ncbi:MAG TPA: caspase family protein [Kofleriaceae bacterium]|nr:caspase family protein [Kofleriaceae bacterium]
MLACALAIPIAAHADPPAPAPEVATYAVVVGSNAGGPGQAELKYAEDDARKMGALLVELGGYSPDHVALVLHPSPEQLRDALAQLGQRVHADADAGRQSRVFFYYSGHARATAIDLGAGEVPLDELRQRLFDVPATLTVVVLDACQSGAFSRVKGARAVADFSISSRQHLDASGVAVLASSSGSELSQESEELRGSYFTHHLLVGLRGAGDANGDGQVSLDEAYRYAYHQTLLATAETAVGGQHVTFEADLKGHGEVPLSFPRAATSAIVLPAPLEGQALVEDKRAHTVVAETYKAKGAAVRVAVAPGDYEVVVRHGSVVSHCNVNGGGEVDLDRCSTEQIHAEATKGVLGPRWQRPTRIEFGALVGNERADAYTATLTNFGYGQGLFAIDGGLYALGVRQISDYIWVGGLASSTVMPEWTRTISGSSIDETFDWSTYTVAGLVRGELPFADHGIGSHFSANAQLDAGLGIGRTRLETGAQHMTTTDTYFGPSFGVGCGLHMRGWLGLLPGAGMSLGYEYDYAPVIKNLLGDTHASGGHRLTLGLTYEF